MELPGFLEALRGYVKGTNPDISRFITDDPNNGEVTPVRNLAGRQITAYK